MDTYYKYSKYFGIESLMEPAIRLSAPAILNDPFEKIFNSVVENNLISSVGNEYYMWPLLESFDIDKEQFIRHQIAESVNNFGIVSLSETHSNLLMWSHYADEHRGICIGYQKDFLTKLPKKITDEHNIANYKPIKVNYNNKRPLYFKDEQNKSNEIKVNTLRQLTSKGDDWIYEKEHRCIVPLVWADEIKIMDSSKLDDFQLKVLQSFKDDFKIINGNRYVFKKDRQARKASCIAFKDNSHAILLKKINPKSIKSIHLGCKMKLSDKIALVSELNKSTHPLNHVEIYDYEESKERYELISKTIKP
ncbi:DUF2971 domain-containing protein [Aeromonas veronii]|uniref:DUF2971 domain-containing protein n=1 Tax=Aeromonas veronii TaxID=654 RepID=UPI003BA05AAD